MNITKTSEGGAAHQARRESQAAAARRHRVKTKFHKATRKAWKKELGR